MVCFNEVVVFVFLNVIVDIVNDVVGYIKKIDCNEYVCIWCGW